MANKGKYKMITEERDIALVKFFDVATKHGYTVYQSWSNEGAINSRVVDRNGIKYPTIEFFEGCRVGFDSREHYVANKRNAIWIDTLPSTKEICIALIITDADKRGQKLASKTLKKVIELATEAKIDVCLECATQDKKNGLNDVKLLKWYKRNGFQPKEKDWQTHLLIYKNVA